MRNQGHTRFTDEQKYEIVLDLLSGELSHAEICRKFGVSATYAYKLRDRAYAILKTNIGRPEAANSNPHGHLLRKIEALEQLAGEQALLIKSLRASRRI